MTKDIRAVKTGLETFYAHTSDLHRSPEAAIACFEKRESVDRAVEHLVSLNTRLLSRPVEPLPTIPGFYVGDYDQSPSGKILIELLNRPAGQWVDNTDSRYLEDEWVRGLGNLTRLVPVGSES